MKPLRVSANGRYFTVDDKPFFWLGDTQWELFRCVTAEEAREILQRRKQQGFTVFQIMATGVGEGLLPNLAGETPWIDNDPAALNEAYFRNADVVMEQAVQEEMVVVLGLFHQLHVNRITCANARAYARKLAARYRDNPAIVWTMYPKATPDYVPVLRELAAGLREGDGGAHLITVHPDPSPTSSSFIHEESWLDFNMSQPCVTYELIYPMVRADYERVPPKPTVMAEGGYEGLEFDRLQTDLEIRKQAYWSHLAGGHHSYGHNDCWVSPQTWREWIEAPGARCLGVYKEIITSCPEWWNGVPDQSVFVSGVNSGLELNAAIRSANHDWILAYLSSNAEVTLRTTGVLDAGSYRAWWIDPRSGARTPLGTFATSDDRTFQPPESWPDAVLLLQSP